MFNILANSQYFEIYRRGNPTYFFNVALLIHARLQPIHPLVEKIEHLNKYINCS